MLTAADVMTRDVITVTPETPVIDLARLFVTHRISSLPVVDGSGNLLGIVTENDLIYRDRSIHLPPVVTLFDWVFTLEGEKRFQQELKKMTGETVGEIYSPDVKTVTPSTTVTEIADILSDRTAGALPVVDRGRLVGIVARVDLIRGMLER